MRRVSAFAGCSCRGRESGKLEVRPGSSHLGKITKHVKIETEIKYMYSQQSYHRPRLLLRQRLFPQLEVKERKKRCIWRRRRLPFFEFADYAITGWGRGRGLDAEARQPAPPASVSYKYSVILIIFKDRSKPQETFSQNRRAQECDMCIVFVE